MALCPPLKWRSLHKRVSRDTDALRISETVEVVALLALCVGLQMAHIFAP